MNYKTHISGGILAAGLYISSQMSSMSIISRTVIIGGALVGSILPDIDHKKSYIGRKSKGISYAVNKLAGHRKLLHGPLIYLLLYSMSLEMQNDKLVQLGIKGIFIGILSHLILDSLTTGGLPWFFPFSKKRFSLGRIKTNSTLENAFCGLLIFINIVLFLKVFHIISLN